MLPVRSKSLFELASVPPVHSESLFEPAVQDHYSKVLVSVALCSESLYSALLCYVHGYGSHFGMRNGRLTLLFTAREPLWRSKWPLGPARVLLERSEGLFRACFGSASALDMAALACPGAASVLKKAAPACFDAASAFKILQNS